MVINIFLILLSLGIFMRGVIYKLSKYKGISKDNKFSFVKTDDLNQFLYENGLASTAYMFLGGVITVCLLIFNIIFPTFFQKYFLFVMLGIFLIDYFIGVIVHIRINIDKQLKEWEEEDKLKAKEKK